MQIRTVLSALALLAFTGCLGGNAHVGTATATPDPVQYTVTASAGSGVTITPASQVVTAGQTATFTVTALTGFINPKVTGCDGTLSGTSFVTAAITADTALTARATRNAYFYEDFESGTTDNWDLTPNTGGAFTVESVPSILGVSTRALKYTAGTTSGNAVIALIKDSVWQTALAGRTDYYVEALIQPVTNSTTGNKQLYLIARYTDASNWLMGGINVQSSTSSTRAEAGNMTSGALKQILQIKEPISNGSWYKVRLVVSGTTQKLYLEGQYVGECTAPDAITSGRIGLFTNNKSFYIDDITINDVADLPVLFSLAPTATSYTAEAGGAAYEVTVTASRSDGSADSFSAVSDHPEVVAVGLGTASGTSTPVQLTPLAAGTAHITFTSGTDPTLVRTLTASITPAYVDSTATYALTSKVFPAVGATTAYADDPLMLTFDSAPTLGSTGSIRIFKASDDSLVDRINLSGESDTLGTGSMRRGVATSPIQISGTTVTITPHRGKLTNGTTYYVGVADTAFTGATLSGQTFAGIGKAAGWTFTTRSTQPDATLASLSVGPPSDLTVDYHTVQGALDHVMTHTSVDSPVITIKNGTYRELLYLYNRANVTLRGESRNGVSLQYDNYESLNSGSGAGASGATTSGGGRSVFLAENCDLLRLDTLTLKNSHVRASIFSNQAETLYFRSSTSSTNSGHRLIANNADFYSEQDTLQLQGYTWFYNSRISGNVDTIWGNNYASLFESCTLETLGDSQYPATVSGYASGTGGYLVQARTYTGGKGFVFRDCVLTYADGPAGVHVATGTSSASTYLARAASGTWVDNVVFINCRMDTHLTALGWASGISGNPAPTPATATTTTGWRECGSLDMSGSPLSVSGRSGNSGQMTTQQVTDAGLGDRNAFFSVLSWTPAP